MYENISKIIKTPLVLKGETESRVIKNILEDHHFGCFIDFKEANCNNKLFRCLKNGVPSLWTRVRVGQEFLISKWKRWQSNTQRTRCADHTPPHYWLDDRYVLWARTNVSSASTILGGGGVFDQYMEMPVQHSEEFGYLLMCNNGLETSNGCRTRCADHMPSLDWLHRHILWTCIKACGAC